MADSSPIGIGEPAEPKPPTDVQTPAVPAAGTSAATAAASTSVTAAAAGTSAGTSEATAVLRGAGTGKIRRTSGVWHYFDLFNPPDAVGKNTRCNVRRSLPPAGMFPARTSMCGARFKYISSDRTSGVHGTGTSGFFNHLKRCHPTVHALVKEASRSASSAKQAKAQVLTGKRLSPYARQVVDNAGGCQCPRRRRTDHQGHPRGGSCLRRQGNQRFGCAGDLVVPRHLGHSESGPLR